MAERQKQMGIIVKQLRIAYFALQSYTRYQDAEKVLELKTIPLT